MNEQILKGHWTELRGKVKEQWGALTDDDLVLAEGNADQLVGIIERRTGESRESIERELERITLENASRAEQLRVQASAAYAAATGSAQQYAGQAQQYVGQAGELAQQQYEQLQQQYEQIAASLRASCTEAEQAIKRNPIESICVAFGTGLIAGVVVGLSLRPRR